MILSTQWSSVRTSMTSFHHNSLCNLELLRARSTQTSKNWKTTSQINSPVVVFGSCSYLRSPKAFFLCSTLYRKKLEKKTETSNAIVESGSPEGTGTQGSNLLGPLYRQGAQRNDALFSPWGEKAARDTRDTPSPIFCCIFNLKKWGVPAPLWKRRFRLRFHVSFQGCILAYWYASPLWSELRH